MEIPSKIVTFIETVNGILAFLTLALLLILILLKSPHRLGTYKYLMIYLSIFEGFYAFLMVSSPSQIYTKDSGFLVVMERSSTWGPMANTLYFTCFGTSLANFGVHFVFRYLVITGNKSWTSTTPLKLVLWISCPLIFGAFYTLTIVRFWGENQATEQFLRLKILSNSSLNGSDHLSFIGFYLFPIAQNGEEYVNWHSITGVVAVSSIITVSITIMLFFGTRCYIEIHKLTSMSTVSQHYRSIQNQLFLALVVQTVIPLALIDLPSTVIAITCFMDCAPRALGQITAICVSLYPVLDPLPNIFIIRSYRRAFFQWMFRCKKSTPEPVYSASNSTGPVAKNVVSPLNG